MTYSIKWNESLRHSSTAQEMEVKGWPGMYHETLPQKQISFKDSSENCFKE